MKFNRAAPVLLLGFGLLIGLIALSGIGALQRARQTYRDVSNLNDRYRKTERSLNAIGSGIYVVGLVARDYLLDPSNVQTSLYRSQLVAERSSMENEFRDLGDVIRTEDKPQLDRLRREVEGYWDALNPLFEWTAEQKAARSFEFLRKEILPRREAALSIARDVAMLAQANLERQRQDIDRRQNLMALFISRMLGATVFLGLAIAAAAVLRMTKLENRSAEQQRRTEAAEQELRRLSRQLVQAQEEERKSISRELHDEAGQMLTALRMELRILQDLRTAQGQEFGEHLEGAKHLVEQSVRTLKDMAMGLRPSMLDDLGLGSAVQWQARQFSKLTGIPVNVQIEGLPPLLPDLHRTCVYRLVQEALTNCARHAKATMIDVAVLRQNRLLVVSVKDDGVGFDTTRVRGRGLGLMGIQERVKALSGELVIVSELRNGTTLSAKIPFTDEVAGDGHSNPLS